MGMHPLRVPIPPIEASGPSLSAGLRAGALVSWRALSVVRRARIFDLLAWLGNGSRLSGEAVALKWDARVSGVAALRGAGALLRRAASSRWNSRGANAQPYDALDRRWERSL